MKREELQNLGLNDEQIEKVMSMHGVDLTNLQSQNKALTETNASLLTEKESMTKQLTDLQAASKGNDDLQARIKELTESNQKSLDAAKSDYDARIKGILIDNALSGKKAKDTRLAKSLITEEQMSKLTVKDDSLEGFDEVFKNIYEGHEYLFDTPSDSSKIGVGGNGSKGGANGNAVNSEMNDIRRAMGLPIKENQ